MTLSGDVWGSAQTMFEEFSATSESKYFITVLNEQLDGPHEGLCLLRVSKIDGTVAHRIKVDTKEPDYTLNYFQNSLIMKPDKKKLVSYQF